MGEEQRRGRLAIPMTPFDERDRIDQELLAAEIEFCIACGVGGILCPALVSGFRSLSEEERRIMIRAPIVANVQAGDLFEKALPTLVIEGLMGMVCAKEIMVRRGVFQNHRMRDSVRPLDESDLREIERVWERIQPYLLWRK